MLSPSARRGRGIAAGVVLAAVIAGNLWGADDHFPFAPFRMYSTTSSDDGSVSVVKFEATTEDGRTVEISSDAVGLRRAEVLGRVDAFHARPALLAGLASNYEESLPHPAHVVGLRLYHGIHELSGGRPAAYREETIARWEAIGR